MENFLTLLTALLLVTPLVGVLHAAPRSDQTMTWYPRFSWEAVPVYKMFGAPQLLTDEQARTIATTSDFICIEKAHGLQALGGAELGAKHEITRLKQLNPRTCALFYFNAARAWPFTTYSQGLRFGQIRDEFKPFIVKDAKTGELAHKERIYCFDVLNPEFRKWWTETVAKAVSDTGADGVFVDQMHGNAWLHPGKQADVAEAQAQMMRMTKQAIGAKKILLLNNGAHIPALFEIGDAFMFEHYDPTLISKENIARDWKLMAKIADAGKISVWRIGVEKQPAGSPPILAKKDSRERRNEKLAAISKEQLNFYLAAFLVGAQEHSYFQYGWGWDVDTGPLVEYAELRMPLGPPKGAARQEAEWIFRREFEHAKVRVDLDKREGTIECTKQGETTNSTLKTD
jgi:hypothetical protein